MHCDTEERWVFQKKSWDRNAEHGDIDSQIRLLGLVRLLIQWKVETEYFLVCKDSK